jgi:hypothetical protein
LQPPGDMNWFIRKLWLQSLSNVVQSLPLLGIERLCIDLV